MIAQYFSRQRVPATESIAVAMVEGARASWREKDKRGHIAWWEIRAIDRIAESFANVL